MKKKITILTLAVLSFGAYAQHNHDHHAKVETKNTSAPLFKDNKIDSVYNQYLSLKDALVASDFETGKKVAAKLNTTLQSTPNAKEAAAHAKAISHSSSLTEQRKTFSALSNQITKLVKSSKLESGAIHMAYCPMANDDEGAYWLSNEREIRNPYFGEMMLKCGSVKETIK